MPEHLSVLLGRVDGRSERFRDTRWLPERLSELLSAKLGAPVRAQNLHRISNGFSWITWAFTLSTGDLEDRELVLRIGPPHGLLAPYSAEREEVILELFSSADVPVPEVLMSHDDVDALDAPFIVVERMKGGAFNPWGIAAAGEKRSLQKILDQFVRILGTIHSTPWQATPAAKLAKGVDVQTAALRQIEFWETRYRQCQLESLPIIEWALIWLKENAPTSQTVSLLHGDYRIGNFLTNDGEISAILDWEMSHFGDPHEDIAWAMYPPFGLPRVMAMSEFSKIYTASSGFAISEKNVAYYSAFNLFKMTVINFIGLAGFVRKSNDMRLATLGFMTASHLSQLMKAIKAAA